MSKSRRAVWVPLPSAAPPALSAGGALRRATAEGSGRHKFRLVFMVAMIATVSAFAAPSPNADCQEFADRSSALPSRGVSRVVIIGGAGFLHVEGRAGATEIRVEGRACAPIEHLLVAMLLKASRSGDVITIKATVPKEKKSFLEAAPRLDFTVIVPAEIAVDVGDTEGELVVRGVSRVHAGVGSGDVEIDQIAGDVELLDKNGSVRVSHAGRNVDIDAHGRIEVSDISGDLTLRSKPAGGLTYVRVGGRVLIAGRVIH